MYISVYATAKIYKIYHNHKPLVFIIHHNSTNSDKL